MITADVNTAKFDEIEEKVLEIKRVSKKTKGGNTIAFAVLVVVGNNNGRVGVGYGKAPDVATSINKAVGKAKKSMVEIKLNGSTISHEVIAKYESAKVFLKPAPKGTGVIAGGAVRPVLELAGIRDISAKMIGANNKISNVRCTLKALKKLKG
ncbi:30S ribosomal protein S5 [candidate division WWE3 bacterium RIFOXYC2_FULL_42_13]|uniref:Small ribosomal subunit protein uS5 n=1 Tax=candidate division WWE3 bacterium TaxID=2053526 RepID=A0A3D0ZRV1_UNCKA|nr:MAG: 30S ribosomal protein S5 [candidate division WWE3 bacterium RIFOXYC2_FULL_42_13]OGC75646.1 MAG: 30S ribosomal protein S5 [candidate division WWE3 bacterium RIFOXYD2_FULL_43_10]HBY09656.1 30S ribosomal protein S5 [candidate division WWE3 bacterium]HCC42428.1 30S ribosomal protein S5 [candidate division WWE3 bacterium]